MRGFLHNFWKSESTSTSVFVLDLWCQWVCVSMAKKFISRKSKSNLIDVKFMDDNHNRIFKQGPVLQNDIFLKIFYSKNKKIKQIANQMNNFSNFLKNK